MAALTPHEMEKVLPRALRVYEQTPHQLASPATLGDAPAVPITREDFRPDGRGFVLRNVLAPSECAQFIAAAEALGRMHALRDDWHIRRVDRVCMMGDDVAAKIFARVSEHFAPIPPARAGGGLQWRPAGLNPCFRICRYERGGRFAPHFDGGFDASPSVRSRQTFMLYLNDANDFDGGATSFFDARQRAYRAPDPEFAYFSLAPEAGACVVFDHALLHDGGELRGGTKYIMRSEVMYRRVPVAAAAAPPAAVAATPAPPPPPPSPPIARQLPPEANSNPNR